MLAVHRFPVYPMLSLWILVLTAATLFWVALTDLREFKVRNEFVAILAGLYLLHALCSGAWVSMQWNFAFALLMLLGGAYAYSLQQIGGGDLKLLAVAFLWTGPWFAAPFVSAAADFYRRLLCRGQIWICSGEADRRRLTDSAGAAAGRGAYWRARVGSHRAQQLTARHEPPHTRGQSCRPRRKELGRAMDVRATAPYPAQATVWKPRSRPGRSWR